MGTRGLSCPYAVQKSSNVLEDQGEGGKKFVFSCLPFLM